MAADGVDADRRGNSGDVCGTTGIAGRLYLYDHTDTHAIARISRDCSAGAAAFGVAVLLGAASGNEVAELGAGRGVCNLHLATGDGAAGDEVIAVLDNRTVDSKLGNSTSQKRDVGHPDV